MLIINFFKNYFSQPIEYYYYINAIPYYRFFGLSDCLFFYAILFLFFLSFALFFYFFKKSKSNFPKLILYFILFFWLITSLRWFLIEVRWLKADFSDLNNRSLAGRRSVMFSRFASSVKLPAIWAEFYDFLEFVKDEVPAGSSVYLLPDNEYFKTFARYWLYPELQLKEEPPADYLLSFDIAWQKKPSHFQVYRGFSPEAFIFKYQP
jgi:hypothetical protein